MNEWFIDSFIWKHLLSTWDKGVNKEDIYIRLAVKELKIQSSNCHVGETKDTKEKNSRSNLSRQGVYTLNGRKQDTVWNMAETCITICKLI